MYSWHGERQQRGPIPERTNRRTNRRDIKADVDLFRRRLTVP
jgi:hypothetical protein